MMFFVILLGNLLCIFVQIVVHEAGHFLFGWAAGIPRGIMRLRLLTFPQHVQLFDGKECVSPFALERYLPIMRDHLPTNLRLYLYTAGGMLTETAFSAAVVLAAVALDEPGVGLIAAGQSLFVFLVYLVLMDVPMAIRRGYPWGDISGLWFVARGPTVVLVVAMVAIRVALIWFTLA